MLRLPVRLGPPEQGPVARDRVARQDAGKPVVAEAEFQLIWKAKPQPKRSRILKC